MRKFATMFLALLCFLTVKAQTTLLVNEGFEVIPHSFTSSTTSGVPNWDTTTALKYAGTTSLRGKVYPTKPVTTVSTAKFSTLGYSKVYLRFKHICRISTAKKGDILYRIGGSSSWTAIPNTPSTYLTQVSGGNLGFLSSIDGFNASSYIQWASTDSTAVPDDTWWKSEFFDITSFVANKDTAQIQFRTQTFGNFVGLTDYGWLIDNIEIIGSNNEVVPPIVVQEPVIYQDTVFGIGPWTINAKVKDESSINSVNLVYTTERNGSLSGPYSIPMTALNDSMFSAEIPSLPYMTKVTYHVYADDQYGNGDQSLEKWFVNKKQPFEVIVGVGTSSQRQPFGASYGFERSASIYTAAEIGTYGTITNMSWSVAGAQTTNIPTKIYLKSTSNTTLTADTWANLITGATLVYDATRSYNPAGWNLLDITDFDYSTNNIMVLCETNYSGTGASNYPTFNYSTTPDNKHELFYQDDTAPTSTGTTNTSRPNIKFGFIQNSVALDAGMFEIVAPSTTLVASTVSDVKVKIKNYGENDLISVKINWELDGVLQMPVYDWSGMLTQDQVSSEITIATGVDFSPGLHIVKVWLTDPNNDVDLGPSNDAIQMNLFSCGGILPAGAYTVGGASPDFSTLEEVKLKLKTCGISGPVTFNIRPGTYYTNVAFEKVLGASAVNTVTLKSENNNPSSVVVFDTTNSIATFVFDTISNFRVQSITLKKTNRFNNKLVLLRGRNVDVQFVNNIFEGLDTNVTSDNYALVYSSKGAAEKDSLIVFDGNTFRYGSIGLYLSAVAANPTSNVTIQNNIFGSQAYRGLHLSYVNKYSVINNSISQNVNSTQNFNGLYFNYCKEGLSISANKVLATKLNCGLYLNYSKGNPLLISNNFIAANTVTSSGLVTFGCGLYVYSSDSVNVFFNTVNLNGIDSVSSRALYLSQGSNINVRNNNLTNNIKGFAYFVNTAPVNLLSNYNNLYSTGAYIGNYAGTTTLNIGAWKTITAKDTNSVSVNPNFLNWDNFHIFEVGLNGKGQALTSVSTDIENNIRNASTPDIGCDEFDVASYDLGVVSIVQPVSTYSCGSTGVTLIARVKNYGLNNVDFATNNATIFASIVGASVQNFNVLLDTGSLASGATRDVQITAAIDFSTPGLYSVKSWSAFPSDTVRLNDSVMVNYDLRKIGTYPYDVDFSSAFNPAWYFTQLSGTIAWQRIQSSILFPTLAPAYGTGMLYFPSHTSTSSGSKSRATTPTFDFTGINRPYLEFWMTQDNGASAFPKEGVIVRISSDGGTTWNNDTLFAARYNSTYSTPGWKLFSKLLTSYANMTCVKIAFDAVSYAGNNIGIDRVVVRDLLDNDLKIAALYAKGKLPIQDGLPDSVTTIIENTGALTQYNKTVTFNLTGANTQSFNYTIDSIQPFTTKSIKLGDLAPTVVGVNTLTVSVPNDGNNNNNTKAWRLETTTNTFSYADTSAVSTKASTTNGLLLAKFHVSGSHIVNSVRAYINGGNTLNKVVYGVLLNNAGAVVARTANDTITASDTANWITFPFIDWTQTVLVDTSFYVGIAQIGSGYTPLGAQAESPVRGGAFYTASLNGGALTPVVNQGRFMIATEIGDLPAYEIALQSITNPVTGCGLGVQPVTVQIKNFGYNNIGANEASVAYSVNGGTPIVVPVDLAIPSNTQVLFSFSPADFSATSSNVTYTIKAWITHPSDVIHYNDTIQNYQFISRPMPSAPTITSGNPMSVSYHNPATITAQSPAGFNGYINWYSTNVSTTPIWTGDTYVSGNLFADTSYYTSFSSVLGFGNTLGTGTVSMNYVPFYYNYDYGWSASIYKSAEIQDVGPIDTVWFQVKSASVTGTITNQKLFLSTTTSDEFADASQPNATSMTLVFSGNLIIPASGWLAVPLSTPFNYDGSGNLLVYWENRDGSYSGNPNPVFSSTAISNASKYKYQDGSFPSTAGTIASSRTNARFYKQLLGCVGPREEVVVDVTDIPTIELQPMSVAAPASGCGLHQEPISVTVKNNLATQAPAGALIYCQINEGVIIADTIDVSINAGQTIPFTFSESYDFSAPSATTVYTLKVWTSVSGDTYMVNDTISYSFESKWTATDLALTDVTIPYGTSHTFTYPDWLRVYSNATATNQIFFGENYPTPILYDTVSYWMEAVQVTYPPINAQIGAGTVTQTSVPFYYNYDYGWSAAIYKRSEFSSFGSIDTVWFQVSSAYTTGMFASQKMYLSVVADTVFAGANQPDRNAMTLVFDGGLNIPASGWIAVPLTAPFTYDGSGSLMLYWENREGSFSGNPSPNWASTTIANVAKYKYQDDSFPEGVSGSVSTSRPNARFTGGIISCPSPLKQITVSVSGVPAQDAGVIKYNGPLGGTYLTTTEHISVVVKNYGTDPISNFPVSYQIGNGTPVTETFTGTLASLDTMTFVFATDQDLNSFLNPLSVKAYTALTGDNYASNDTVHGVIALPIYCASNATSPAVYMDLGNVTFAGINNGIAYPIYNNTTAVNGYSDFAQTVAPAYVAKGATYPFSATQINKLGYSYQGKVKVYIDLNRNGVFDASEIVFTANSTTTTATTGLTYAQSTASGYIVIPVSAQSGVTRMRVVLDESDASPACGTYTYGETEDYALVIYSATDPDASLTNFVMPNNPSRVEGEIQSVKVNLLNVGTNPITAASITVIHNGVETVKSWTGSLAAMSSVVDSITSVTLVAGVNDFTAFVDLTGDNMHFNDTIHFRLNALPLYDVKPVSVLNPIAMSCPNINETIVVRITNIGQDTINFATNNVLVKAQVLIHDVAEYQTTISTGVLPVNGTLDVPVTTAANFSTGGAYKIKAMVFLIGDGNLLNDTIMTDSILMNTAVATLPAIENFQTFAVGTGPFPDNWTSTTSSTTTNKYLWSANTGATLSGAASGPNVDHTLGNATGKYAYVYGGYGTSGDVSQLISKCYNFVGVPGQANSVSFWYHMFNPGTNAKLYVEYGSGSNWITLDSLIDQQQTTQVSVWRQKLVTIPSENKNGRIRFKAQRGSTAGDIAIDDINFQRLLPDVGVLTIVAPAQYPLDSVMTGSQVTVTARIHNYGQLPLDTVPVAYRVGSTGSEIVETHIGTIAPGGDVDYTFTTTYEAPSARFHYLCVYTKLAYDADTNNNRSCRNVTDYVGFDDFDVAQFNLSQNVPNPACDNAVIGFNMPQAGKVMFRVTDVLGKELYVEEISAIQGANTVNLNTVNFATGMYYYWVEFKDKRLSKKMNIIK